jgi:hypothetical protein
MDQSRSWDQPHKVTGFAVGTDLGEKLHYATAWIHELPPALTAVKHKRASLELQVGSVTLFPNESGLTIRLL